MFSSKPFTFVWFIKIVLSCRFFRLLSRSSAHSMHESCPVLYVSRQYSEPDSLLSSHWEIKGELKPSWPENVKKKKKKKKKRRRRRQTETNKQTNKQTKKKRRVQVTYVYQQISLFICCINNYVYSRSTFFLLRIWAHQAAAGHVLWFALYKWKAERDWRMT